MFKIIQIILKNWKWLSIVLPYISKITRNLFNRKIMEDTRNGFLTEEQESTIDLLIPLNGIAEKVDGIAIKLIDNQGLERLKPSLIEKYGEGILPDIYEVIDAIFIPLNELAKNKN